MKRVVLDTNIVIAAFAARGLCESVFTLCLQEHELYISNFLVSELREKLLKKLKLPQSQATEILNFYATSAALVEPVAVSNKVCRYPDDLFVLGTASAARADYIVTGDKDLLVLEHFESTVILSPRAFYENLQG